MLKRILDWIKKDELESICILEGAFKIRGEQIDKLRDEVLLLESKLADSIKIANNKKVIKCYNKKCMDYDPETGGCTLNKVIITLGGRCEDYDDGSTMQELEEGINEGSPVKININGTLVTLPG